MRIQVSNISSHYLYITEIELIVPASFTLVQSFDLTMVLLVIEIESPEVLKLLHY